jgi:hypothetical protein
LNQRSLGGLDRKRPTNPQQNAMEEVAHLSPVFDVLRRRRPDLTADFARRYPELNALEEGRILRPGSGEPGALEGLRPGSGEPGGRRSRGEGFSSREAASPAALGRLRTWPRPPSMSRKPTSMKFCRF